MLRLIRIIRVAKLFKVLMMFANVRANKIPLANMDLLQRILLQVESINK